MLSSQTPPVSYLISNGVLNDSHFRELQGRRGGGANARFINQETFPVDMKCFALVYNKKKKCLVFFSSLFRVNTPRKQGGLGNMKIPLVSDLSKSISKEYGVLKEEEGISFRSVKCPFNIKLF